MGAQARKIFTSIDANWDGMVNKRELVRALRKNSDIAEFFGLPRKIKIEDGSKEALEKVFHLIDTDSNHSVSWEEFQKYRGVARASVSTRWDISRASRADFDKCALPTSELVLPS